MNHDEQTVERVAGELARDTYYHGSTTCECGHDFGHTRVTDTEMQWHVARAALSAIPRPTESDVATAVYRHFTTPNRDDILGALERASDEWGKANTSWHLNDGPDPGRHLDAPTTVAELEALPESTVVLAGGYAWQKIEGEWISYCSVTPVSSADLALHYGPITVLTPAAEPVTAEQAFDVFVRSFNGDEAGDIDDVSSLDGNTGWAMRGGNDVRAVFDKALRANVPVTDEEAT